MQDLQRADPDALHHADGERVDVEVGDDEQVARVAARRCCGTCHALGLHDVREDVARGSASRPSACRSCRRCTAAPRRRPDRSARAADRAAVAVASRSASVDARRRRAAARPPRREYSASDVTMIVLDARSASRTPSASGASASSVISIRMPESRGDGQHLARRVARVDVDDDRAEPQHRERRDDVLRTVGQHDADAVALDDAEPRRARRRAVGRGP